MSKLKWDQPGEKLFETGVYDGVLYVMQDDGTYGTGVAWNGLTAVTESPSGAENTDLWADDNKYASIRSAEDFGATIEAYMYPDAWGLCDGSAEPVPGLALGQQKRKAFAFVFKTLVGNDADGIDSGDYKLHIIYNATANVAERAYATVNDSPDAITLSWEITTNPIPVTGYKPTAHITIDSRKFTSTAAHAKLMALEDELFGTDPVGEAEGTEPTLVLPDDVIEALTTTTSGGGDGGSGLT